MVRVMVDGMRERWVVMIDMLDAAMVDVTIDVVVETLRVAEFLTPTLMEQLK